MIDNRYLRLALTALWGALALALLCSTPGRADTLWLALTDSTGYTVQNMDADFRVEMDGAVEQPSGMQNIALNYCTLTNSTTLARPALSLPTRLVHFPAALADSLLNTPLDGESPRQAAVKAIAEYLVGTGEFEALTVRKTGTGGTSAVATYP